MVWCVILMPLGSMLSHHPGAQHQNQHLLGRLGRLGGLSRRIDDYNKRQRKKKKAERTIRTKRRTKQMKTPIKEKKSVIARVFTINSSTKKIPCATTAPRRQRIVHPKQMSVKLFDGRQRWDVPKELNVFVVWKRQFVWM